MWKEASLIFLPGDNNSHFETFLFFPSHFRPNGDADEISAWRCLLRFWFLSALLFCSSFLHSVASFFMLPPASPSSNLLSRRDLIPFKKMSDEVRSVSFLPIWGRFSSTSGRWVEAALGDGRTRPCAPEMTIVGCGAPLAGSSLDE